MDDRIIGLFSCSELALAMNAKVIHPQNQSFTEIATDSRKIVEGSLFVALSGERFDAHDFVSDTVKSGARGAIVSKILDVPENYTLFLVDDVLKAFGRLAKAILEKRRSLGNFTTYGITGSNGKTTTKEMLASLLIQKNHKVLKTEGNHNNFVGLPITVSELRTSHDVAVLEMGTNAHGEITYLANIAQPDIAIITGIGSAHLEGFGSVDGVAKAKGEILFAQGLKKVILPNATHRFYDGIIPKNVQTIWVGEHENIHSENISMSLSGLDFDIIDQQEKYHTHLPLLGEHNAENFVRAYAAVSHEHLTESEINQAASIIVLPSGRLERWTGQDGESFLHDAYNANPSSMIQALNLMKKITTPDKRCLILGTMGELGTNSDQLHIELGQNAASIGAVKILCVGDSAKYILQGAVDAGFGKDNILAIAKDDLDTGIQWLKPSLKPDVLCLIKGSRSVRLERILDAFHAIKGINHQA